MTSPSLSRTAVLLGSTGLIGSSLKQILKADSSSFGRVTCLVRKSTENLAGNATNCQAEVVNFDSLERHATLFNTDIVFCCLGTTIKAAGSKEAFRKVDFTYPLEAAKLLKKMNPNGHFILVSSLGADAKSNVFYSKTKGELENEISKLGLKQFTALRPSLLLGDRKENRPGEKAGAIAAIILKPILIGPFKKYRPIAAESVAKAMRRISLETGLSSTVFIESNDIAQLAERQ